MDALTDRLQASLGDAFTIERELGGGAMSRVFLARDHALDRNVVVKTLDLEASAAGSDERFRREVRTIAKLQHPHVVPLLTAGGDGTLLWYAMPFVAGESLRARLLREGALPLPDALRIMRELLDALGFAHEHGVVHRDVKPENILLEGKHAVVADFGIAKAVADAVAGSGLTSAGMALGTPAYMAPEQAMADPTMNHRADLYAAGAVMYEMLVGAPPYSGNAQAVVAAHLTAPVPRVSDRRRDVPPAIASTIEHLLAKNPAERPQTAQEALTSLEDVTTPGGTPMTSAATAGQTAAPLVITARQSRVMLGGIAVSLVAAFAIVGTWWARRGVAAPVTAGADVIAVMPLGTTGDSALARLGRDLVVTLSANLDGVGALRAVDATSVITRAPQALPLDRARSLARELGARSVLHGSLVREGGLVMAEMVLAPIDGGEPLARVSARAPADSVRALTDSLTNDVLRQVWLRGKAPSSMLSEVTTKSNEALRAFLAGEAHFQRFAWDSALADYGRAAAADSMFAQAFLRIDYVRNWAAQPPDATVRARLIALMDRLPQRDRQLLALQFARGLSTRERIDSGIVLAARYPDYPAAQYEPADRIIHVGPVAGVPISRALPYLDRLDVLAPNHADNALHRILVADVLGDTAMLVATTKRLEADASGPMQEQARDFDQALNLRAAGSTPSVARVTQALRLYAADVRASPQFAWNMVFTFPFASPAVIDSSIANALREGVFAGIEPVVMATRGNLAIARGDFGTGLVLLAPIETSRAPAEIRLGAARTAALGSWMGMVPVAVADSVVSRARTTLADVSGLDASELQWLDGVVGIAAGDSARVFRAAATITDTGLIARRLPSSLRALWNERRTQRVDRLVALEDSAMTLGGTFPSSALLHRLAIGRALTRAGDPVAAEHYLQWTDTRYIDARASSVLYTFGPYSSYQRALAFEAAGDKPRAMLHFERFLDMVDRPPPSVKPQVDDAKARLARLAGDARR